MVFLMIVPSIIIVAVVFIHETAKFLDVKIPYTSLAICTILSLLIDVAATEISTAQGREYFFILFALIFVAAAVVTVINSYLEVRK